MLISLILSYYYTLVIRSIICKAPSIMIIITTVGHGRYTLGDQQMIDLPSLLLVFGYEISYSNSFNFCCTPYFNSLIFTHTHTHMSYFVAFMCESINIYTLILRYHICVNELIILLIWRIAFSVWIFGSFSSLFIITQLKITSQFTSQALNHVSRRSCWI